jgi:hypothetical protein
MSQQLDNENIVQMMKNHFYLIIYTAIATSRLFWA